MNKPVSFELAKLLKEKGFEIFTAFEYTDSGKLVERRNCAQNRLCSAPTIAEVVMWLYEKHGIWISVHSTRGYFVGNWTFHNTHKGGDTNVFSSPTEAYKAVIEYALNNLV